MVHVQTSVRLLYGLLQTDQFMRRSFTVDWPATAYATANETDTGNR